MIFFQKSVYGGMLIENILTYKEEKHVCKNKQRRNAFCIRRRIPAKMLRAYFNKEFLCSKKFSENLTGVQTPAITTALGISPRPWKKRTLKSGDSRKWFCGARNAEQSFVIQGGKTWKKSILGKF